MREHEAIAPAILGGETEPAERLMTAHVGFDAATAMDLLAMMDPPG